MPSIKKETRTEEATPQASKQCETGREEGIAPLCRNGAKQGRRRALEYGYIRVLGWRTEKNSPKGEFLCLLSVKFCIQLVSIK